MKKSIFGDVQKKNKRVLIVGTDTKQVNALTLELAYSGHAAQSALNIEHALPLLQNLHFDCAIIDVMTNNENGSVSILQFIQKGIELNHNLAIIALSDQEDYGNNLLKQRYSNIVNIVSKEITLQELCYLVDHLPTRQVLVVDDDPEFCLLLRKELERGGYSMKEAYDIDHAIELLSTRRFLCAVLDVVMGPGQTSTLSA